MSNIGSPHCWILPAMHGNGLAINLVKYYYQNINYYFEMFILELNHLGHQITNLIKQLHKVVLTINIKPGLIISLVTITKMTLVVAQLKDLEFLHVEFGMFILVHC